MKKKIYPISFLYIVTMSLFLIISLVSLYTTIICSYKLFIFKAYVLIIPITATLFSTILFWYVFVCNICNKMILNNEGIAITGQKMKNPIQHKEFISFLEIKNVKLICAHIDSKGKRLNITGIASSRPHIFFEFELQNESLKRIYIEIYSLRQRKQMLDIINKKTGLALSYDKLERKDYSIYRRNKKKK